MSESTKVTVRVPVIEYTKRFGYVEVTYDMEADQCWTNDPFDQIEHAADKLDRECRSDGQGGVIKRAVWSDERGKAELWINEE